jgi:hypothetical protein
MVTVPPYLKPALNERLRHYLQTFTGTLSLWSQPDVVQDQMLYRVHLCGGGD